MGNPMMYPLAFAVTLCSFFVLLVSSRLRNDWLTSPATMMAVYFLFAMLPGLVLESRDSVAIPGIFAYLIWMIGAIVGVFVSGMAIGSRRVRRDSLDGNYPVIMFFVLLSVPCILITYALLGRIPLLVGLDLC